MKTSSWQYAIVLAAGTVLAVNAVALGAEPEKNRNPMARAVDAGRRQAGTGEKERRTESRPAPKAEPPRSQSSSQPRGESRKESPAQRAVEAARRASESRPQREAAPAREEPRAQPRPEPSRPESRKESPAQRMIEAGKRASEGAKGAAPVDGRATPPVLTPAPREDRRAQRGPEPARAEGRKESPTQRMIEAGERRQAEAAGKVAPAPAAARSAPRTVSSRSGAENPPLMNETRVARNPMVETSSRRWNDEPLSGTNPTSRMVELAQRAAARNPRPPQPDCEPPRHDPRPRRDWDHRRWDPPRRDSCDEPRWAGRRWDDCWPRRSWDCDDNWSFSFNISWSNYDPWCDWNRVSYCRPARVRFCEPVWCAPVVTHDYVSVSYSTGWHWGVSIGTTWGDRWCGWDSGLHGCAVYVDPDPIYVYTAPPIYQPVVYQPEVGADQPVYVSSEPVPAAGTFYRAEGDLGAMDWSVMPHGIISAVYGAPASQRAGVAAQYLARRPAGAWQVTFESQQETQAGYVVRCRAVAASAIGDEPVVELILPEALSGMRPGKMLSVTGLLVELSVDDPENPAGVLTLRDARVSG